MIIYKISNFCSEHVPFVDEVFAQNTEILHGGQISRDEWYTCLCAEPDPDEIHFIVTSGGENAAWLKLNGLSLSDIYISMLVVAKSCQRKGVGSFAVQFTEEYAREKGKSAVIIQTTKDNTAAINFYLKQGYKIEKDICYAVGDGIMRDGYRFKKELEADE